MPARIVILNEVKDLSVVTQRLGFEWEVGLRGNERFFAAAQNDNLGEGCELTHRDDR